MALLVKLKVFEGKQFSGRGHSQMLNGFWEKNSKILWFHSTTPFHIYTVQFNEEQAKRFLGHVPVDVSLYGVPIRYKLIKGERT